MADSRVLFVDIARFSVLPVDRQVALIRKMNDTLRQSAGSLLTSANDGEASAIALPTGDGFALAYLRSGDSEWDVDRILIAAISMTQFAAREGISLRIGIHAGEVEIVEDINGHRNICGSAINEAQRVMNAANDAQVLLSEPFIRQHMGENCTRHIECSEGGYSIVTRSVVPVVVKHGHTIGVVPLAAIRSDGVALDGWDESVPQSSRQLPVRLTNVPKYIDTSDDVSDADSFGAVLSQAKTIALVQLTGENLLPRIEDGSITFCEALSEMWVFMPRSRVIRRLRLSVPLGKVPDHRSLVRRWQNVMRKTKDAYPHARIHFGLLHDPPFFGGSFIDWQTTDCRIHISPYIWGMPMSESPGFEIARRGTAEHPVISSYISGLNSLYDSTTNSI